MVGIGRSAQSGTWVHDLIRERFTLYTGGRSRKAFMTASKEGLGAAIARGSSAWVRVVGRWLLGVPWDGLGCRRRLVKFHVWAGL